MKKLFILIAIFTASMSFSQISLTGQLTTGDSYGVGNNSNYLKLSYSLQEINIDDIRPVPTRSTVIIVNVVVYKSRSSYSNAKQPQTTNEIKTQYIIDATAIATSPASNLNSLPGHSLHDKEMYWIAQKVLALIISDNPTFTGTIVDINL